METGEPGRVILLNGPSSAGKSSIARALQRVLVGPWFHVPVDALGAMRGTGADPAAEGVTKADVEAVLRRTRLGYHRVVAGLASVGNDVIMDYPLSEPWRLVDLLAVLDGIDVTLVDVRCSAAVLDRREGARGDRPRGLAGSQTGVFDHDDRDLVVDTTSTSAEDCAAALAAAYADLGAPRAFERLRHRGL